MLWRTEDGEIIDPRVAEKRLARTTDLSLWIDTAILLVDPLTKTDAPKDISERLTRNFEFYDMDFTQTEFMKSKKERSRGQVKERKEIKKMFLAKTIRENNRQLRRRRNFELLFEHYQRYPG